MNYRSDILGDVLSRFVAAHDFSSHTVRALRHDVSTFVNYFERANNETFSLHRVTAADVAGLKDFLRNAEKKSVSTVNRNLVSLRSLFKWLVDESIVGTNPCLKVKEIARQQSSPKGLDKIQVRKLLREIELRNDIRSDALFSLFLFTGCRVGDVVGIELSDLYFSERTATIRFRHGKGNKERSVPVPLIAKKAMQNYLSTRPISPSTKIFIGERGPLTDRGIRTVAQRYSAICGFHIHPHLLRHTFSKQFLVDSGNDLTALAQILGHSSIATTAIYAKQTVDSLGLLSDKVAY